MPRQETGGDPLSVTLPPDVVGRLRAAADGRGIQVSEAIQEAVDAWLRKHEQKPQPWHLPLDWAVVELGIWERSVRLQLCRILDNLDAVEERLKADAQLMALALRQVLRFAELCLDVAPDSARHPIQRALDAFNTTSPHAKDLRDVLDHMDAYLRGTGLAFPAGPAGQEYKFEGQDPHQPGFRIFRPADSWLEKRDHNLLFFVALAPSRSKKAKGKGKVLFLDVSRDARAAFTLCDVIRDVWREVARSATRAR